MNKNPNDRGHTDQYQLPENMNINIIKDEELDVYSPRHQAIKGLMKGDVTPLVEFFDKPTGFAQGILGQMLFKALSHAPDADWHFVLKKNPARIGKGQSHIDQSNKKQLDFKIFCHLLTNKIYERGNGANAYYEASEYFRMSESSIKKVWERTKNVESYQYFITSHKQGDRVTVGAIAEFAQKKSDMGLVD